MPRCWPLTTTHPVEQLGEANLIVPGLTHVVVDLAGSGSGCTPRRGDSPNNVPCARESATRWSGKNSTIRNWTVASLRFPSDRTVAPGAAAGGKVTEAAHPARGTRPSHHTGQNLAGNTVKSFAILGTELRGSPGECVRSRFDDSIRCSTAGRGQNDCALAPIQSECPAHKIGSRKPIHQTHCPRMR
jgi:hypothetical protein